MKGDYLLFDHTPGAVFPNIPADFYGSTPANGYVRSFTRVLGGTFPADQIGFWDQLRRLLFKGERGTDWENPLTAPTETKHLSIKHDFTKSVSSGNDVGVLRTHRRWHRMNHNLVYDDDEVAGGLRASDISIPGQAGMGDYYVVDMFEAPLESTADDTLVFNPESTLYWHER